MRIGINGGGGHRSVQTVRKQATEAAHDGFASYWLSQIFGVDALTALAAVAPDAPGLELGVAVVPTYPRHPSVLAMQALTVQEATGGRLLLGIGPSHAPIVERMWGHSFDRPYTHTREYLRALRGFLTGEPVDLQGEEILARGKLDTEVTPPPVLVAGLGPRMLELAGSEADGTVTWMCGVDTVIGHIAPGVRAAAERAGRPEPRIVVGLPVCITDEPERARAHATTKLAMYGGLRSYRAMLDREGVEGPEGIVLIGSEEEIAERFEALASAGVTDLRAALLDPSPEDVARTRAFLKNRLRSSGGTAR